MILSTTFTFMCKGGLFFINDLASISFLAFDDYGNMDSNSTEIVTFNSTIIGRTGNNLSGTFVIFSFAYEENSFFDLMNIDYVTIYTYDSSVTNIRAASDEYGGMYAPSIELSSTGNSLLIRNNFDTQIAISTLILKIH